jgi:hypothetical protein
VTTSIPYSVATTADLKDTDIVRVALAEDALIVETAWSAGASENTSAEPLSDPRHLTITVPDIAKLQQAKEWVRAVKVRMG